MSNPPEGYFPLPAGAQCRCPGLWRAEDGGYWCCGRFTAKAHGDDKCPRERIYWDHLFRARVAIIDSTEYRDGYWLIIAELLEDAQASPPACEGIFPYAGAIVCTTEEYLEPCTVN